MIGIEVHCQLNSLKTKLFCPCSTGHADKAPNTNICPVCTGLPGSLPRLNRMAVEKAAIVAMALNCSIPERIAFFRKNYFYPDLPKNYQITQLDVYGKTSMGSEGYVETGSRRVRIRRVQLEEDPGRITYEGASESTKTALVDYNRAGMPLVEIVTEPDFESPAHVREFLNMLSEMLENLSVSDTSMEGAMRADGNVSVGDGPKVEVKNVGSFHDLEKALNFELTRQGTFTDRNIKIDQETRQWDAAKKSTVSARKKEDEYDYRYIPESDIPHVEIDDGVRTRIRAAIPESVSTKRDRYFALGIPKQVAAVLSSDPRCLELFEDAHTEKNCKEVANLITTDFMGLADTRKKRALTKITARHFTALADAVLDRTISRRSAKEALAVMHDTGRSLEEIILELNLASVTDISDIEPIVDEILKVEAETVSTLAENPQAIHYLLGKVMQKTHGKADPKVALDLLRKKT